MSDTLRQSNLFQGQDWTVIYQAMKQINFNSYDYATIRQALITYIQTNYPEDFNDWIENSEFIAIIEMLAYIAGSLAFRIDLNTRENFLDTATRRESIFRLARMLSYNPRRCLTSQGLLKLTSVSTTQTIYDSNGNNLSGLTINWNDANNPDWYEQFVLILNASFQNSNPFGLPVKSGTVGSLTVQRYDFNNAGATNLVYAYSTVVGGTGMSFEFINSDFTSATGGSLNTTSSGYYQEKPPSIYNPWSILYRSDGNGNASANTGFFVLFKEGSLQYTDYSVTTQIPNLVIDVDAQNVNQTDVWVQTVDDSGIPLLDWTNVPAIFNSNLVYNNLDLLTRDIFQVITRDVGGIDSISVKFGDGNFGNIPTGRIRVYYRTSNNLTYSIQPPDMQNQTLALPYTAPDGSTQSLSMTYGLQYTVSNSLAREDSASIQNRAPAVYYTQNRMVNGEDYNIFPLLNSQALKVHAVNRTYAGQSRFLDINDPTSEYSNTKVFSDDGILWVDHVPVYQEVLLSSNLNTTQIIDQVLQPLLNSGTNQQNVNVGLRNFYLYHYETVPSTQLFWAANTGGQPGFALKSAVAFNTYIPQTLPIVVDNINVISLGAIVQFSNGTWATVTADGNSSTSNYTQQLSVSVPTGTEVIASYPDFRVNLNDNEISAIASALNDMRSFGLGYDYGTSSWYVIASNILQIDADFVVPKPGTNTATSLGNDWLVQFVYKANKGWEITQRSTQFMFTSEKDVQFFFVNTAPIIDSYTQTIQNDNVRILKYTTDVTGASLGTDQYWNVLSQVTLADGSPDPTSIQVMLASTSNGAYVTDPLAFEQVVLPTELVFWQQTTTGGYYRWVPFSIPSSNIFANYNALPAGATWTTGQLIYVINPGVFLQYTASGQWQDVSVYYKARRGRNSINYCWQHYAGSNARIDPAIMNIIDIYVLTANYNTAIRNWVSNSTTTDPVPQPPSPEDLRSSFSDFDNYKMLSDQLVWHPISYKLLFGAQADPELRASFKVVRIPNSSITDSEIKNMVIQAIDQYFAVSNWDFGQSFYFTELAAYIHQQLATMISSIVIVPNLSNAVFGDLFQIQSNPNEIFLSCARVTDVQVVTNLNPAELRQ
jgi:hypothetical protein